MCRGCGEVGSPGIPRAGGKTTTPLGTKTGFRAPAHYVDEYEAGPPAEWGSVAGYSVPQ